MQYVITISGPARHGKTTTAETLKRMLEQKKRRVMILNFADYLKLIAERCFGYKGENYKVEADQRAILQKVGTELGRKYDENFWANIVKSTIVAFQDEFDVAIIADARYPNECDMFKYQEKTGLVKPVEVVNLKVLRRNFDNKLSEENKSHASENGLRLYDFDHYIDSETIQELEDKLVIFIERFLTPRPKVAEEELETKTKKYGK